MAGTLLPNALATIRKVKREMAVFATSTVAAVTPIDTGQAKSNWFVQENIPANQVLQFGPVERVSATTAEATSQARADALPEAPAGDIYISNHLDYIADLENGSSSQAPGGMLAVTHAAVLAKGR